jgi:hypothetical protein
VNEGGKGQLFSRLAALGGLVSPLNVTEGGTEFFSLSALSSLECWLASIGHKAAFSSRHPVCHQGIDQSEGAGASLSVAFIKNQKLP